MRLDRDRDRDRRCDPSKQTSIPYSPANDMLWLVYFLGQSPVLMGGGIVHKGFEIRLVPKTRPRGVFGGGNRCETTIPNFGASERQIGTSQGRGGHGQETIQRRRDDDQMMGSETRSGRGGHGHETRKSRRGIDK